VVEQSLFKVTRDADIGVDEDRDDDFIVAMEEVLVNRQNSWPVRLSISAESEALEEMIRTALGLEDRDVYALEGPIDLKGFMELSDIKGFDKLRYPVNEPRVPSCSPMTIPSGMKYASAMSYCMCLRFIRASRRFHRNRRIRSSGSGDQDDALSYLG